MNFYLLPFVLRGMGDFSSEGLFFWLSAGLPPAGPLLDAQMWAEKPPGRPRTPFFAQSVFTKGRYPVAAECPLGLRPPRNRCGGLRTSPDGPRAESGFLFCGREPECLPQTQEARHRNQDSPAPSKGRQAKSDTQPAADRMPEGIWPLLWLRSIKSGSVRLGKPGSGGPPAAFWLLCRRGQSNPRLRRGIPPNSLEG